jgi:hypothetical protein
MSYTDLNKEIQEELMNQKSLELWMNRIDDKKASGLKVIDWYVKNNMT